MSGGDSKTGAVCRPALSPVTSGGRAVFKALMTERLCTPKHKHDVFIDECFGAGRFKIEAPMKGLFMLNRSRNEGYLPKSVYLLPTLMKEERFFCGGKGRVTPGLILSR